MDELSNTRPISVTLPFIDNSSFLTNLPNSVCDKNTSSPFVNPDKFKSWISPIILKTP